MRHKLTVNSRYTTERLSTVEFSKMGSVYSITNLKTNQKYIGSTIGLIRKRWNAHKNQLRRGIHANTRLQESWRVHGEDSFLFEVLEECDTARARFLEKQWVEKEDPYFNIVPVGALPDNRRKLKDHEIQRLRERFKGIPLTPEHRRKIALANTGFKHSEATKKKMSDKKKGRQWSESMRKTMAGKPKKRCLLGIPRPEKTSFRVGTNLRR